MIHGMKRTSLSSTMLGVLAVTGASALWSTLGIFGKLFQEAGVDPLSAAALRALSAFVILLITRPLWVRWFPPRALPWSPWKKIPYLAVYGVVSLTGMYAHYFVAVVRASVSMAVILLYTAPTLVLVLSLLFGLEKFRPQRLVGILLAFAGIILLGSASLGGGDILGFLAGLGAGLCYASYSIFGAFALRRLDQGTLNLWTMGFAALAFLPLWVMNPGGMWHILSTPYTLLLVFLMGLGPSAMSFTLYLWGLKRIPPSLASVNCTWEPVLGVTWGVLLFHESLTVLQWGGALLIVVSVIAVSLQAARQAAP
jgi:DME family drug/metabolite transporter